MEKPHRRTLEGFIYWLSIVILIWFLPLVNFFLQNFPSWAWESFSDSSWMLIPQTSRWPFDLCLFFLSLYYTSPLLLFLQRKLRSRFHCGAHVSSRLTIEAVTDGLQFCLPWPRQHQKLLSNLSHLWQPLSREMRQSLWHKGFWPGVKNSFWKKSLNSLQTTLLSIHLAVWPIHPQLHISFQTL